MVGSSMGYTTGGYGYYTTTDTYATASSASTVDFNSTAYTANIVEFHQTYTTEYATSASTVKPYYVGGTYIGKSLYFSHAFAPETAAEKVAREKREAEVKAAREAAEKKAEKLLRRVAGEEVYRQFKETGFLTITGKSGQRYRLRVNQKVDVLDGDRVDHRLCAVARDWTIPKVDELVAKFLILTVSEEEFRKVAIKHAA